MEIRARRHAILALICSITVLLSATEPSAQIFQEDFTSLIHSDQSTTTAWWDTLRGEIKLHPLEPTLVGATLFYFLFVYMYQGKMVGLLENFKGAFSSAFVGG